MKTLKQNVTFVQTFFNHPFDCPKVNFGPMARRNPQSPNVNHKTISSDKFTGLPKSDGKHQSDSSWKPSDSEYNVISHCVTLPESVLETIDHHLASFFSKNSMSLLLTFYILSECLYSNIQQVKVGWEVIR